MFLYVWEDNDRESYSVSINERPVLEKYRSGRAGEWERLGPWHVDSVDDQIVITSEGGAANFSGIELWKGEHDGTPLPEHSAEHSAEQLAFFENRIRPLLIERCYECHSEQADMAEGDLLVDSAATLRRGGAMGPAVVPGDLNESLLVEAIRHTNDQLQMPPDEKLGAEDIAALEQWVLNGAVDPRLSPTRVAKKSIDIEQARKFWSFRPLTDPAVPEVNDRDWPSSDVDRFVLARLEQNQLDPLGHANKRTLIRRATYDLTGLPPTPDQVDRFLQDDSPRAFASLVERLLASPQYGERWGRHWMDLVRYADTAGENSDFPIPQAYRYRNYIIESFNVDKPYDQFIREQIAGDLMPADSDEQRNERIIATGYIASARRFGSVIKDYPQHLTIEDTIDNVGRVMLGLTLSCSRCHDHKFDPISQSDYYGLYGFFQSTKYAFPGIELDQEPRDFVSLYQDGTPSKQLAYAVTDDRSIDANVHLRGDPNAPGELIPRKFLDLLGGQRLSDEQSKQSGRRQLADWITDRDNPLTARVMVNRIWQHHFGSGLVRTPSNFGTRGLPPTHPELLDWLASRFIENGWSIKQMHRIMMNSRVYQLASVDDSEPGTHRAKTVAEAYQADPNNELLWRYERRRLDAESLRDSLLAVSGELDMTPMNEPHPFPAAEKWKFTQHHPFRDCYESQRRSVYLMTARLNARPYFSAFDGADRNASTATRDRSVTTVQSLYLLNNEFVHECATKFARRLLAECDSDLERLRLAFELTSSRCPDEQELTIASEFLASMKQDLSNSGLDRVQLEHGAWTSFARAIFRTNEFLYVD